MNEWIKMNEWNSENEWNENNKTPYKATKRTTKSKGKAYTKP